LGGVGVLNTFDIVPLDEQPAEIITLAQQIAAIMLLVTLLITFSFDFACFSLQKVCRDIDIVYYIGNTSNCTSLKAVMKLQFCRNKALWQPPLT
jgi:hypothetical protein